MRNKLARRTLAALSLLWPVAAIAGECPAGDRWETLLKGAPEKATGATQGAVESIALEPEIGVPGRALRLRQVTLAPGASVPAHSHAGRPSIMYVVAGEATEFTTRCRNAVVHRAGDSIRETGDFSHWWKNAGKVPTVLIVTEVVAVP